MDYDRFLNSISSRRTYSPLRRLWALQDQAGPLSITLGSGVPNPASFPIQSVIINTTDGKSITFRGQELHMALNYTDTLGFPPLLKWLLAFQKRMHDPPYARENPALNKIIVVPGSQDGLCKTFEMLIELGDPILLAEPAYSCALAILRPMEVKFLAIQADQNGTNPESMRRILEEQKEKGKKMPKVLLIQPNHCNPTGLSTTLERRLEIYQLACQYDLLIVEDDPYYFLTFNTSDGESRIPPASFLSLDTEGRVLRLESFSKILAPGLRIGTVSGPRALIDRIEMHLDCSSMQASGFNQAIVFRLLNEYGQEGFLKRGESVAKFYENRCNTMLRAAERHLTGVVEWKNPSGGMFLWLKMLTVNDTRKLVTGDLVLKKMVRLTPGNIFMCDDSKPTPFVRASFSWAKEEEMVEGFRRLAEVIKEDKFQLANE